MRTIAVLPKVFLKEDRQEAVALWNDGFDTLDISIFFGVHEHVIANKLWQWRAEFKREEAA
jgi:hypothetical protein